jgi:hypothetical protein
MPYTMATNVDTVLAGTRYLAAYSAIGDNVSSFAPEVAAAKTGTLSTRTNDTSGTLTMDSGHGFTTGVIIDLYWSGGSRYNVVVGTVSGDSVPFSSGSGDNLPTATTAITAMVQHEETFVVTGNNVSGLALSAGVAGYVHFTETGNTNIASIELIANGQTVTDPFGYTWLAGLGDNPLASGSVGKVKFSHGQVSAQTMRATALYS